MQTVKINVQRRPSWVLRDVKTQDELIMRKEAFGSGCSQDQFNKNLTKLKQERGS